MQIEQRYFISGEGWRPAGEPTLGATADWVLVFGSRERVADARLFGQVRAWYPEARLVLGSTSGEILDTEVSDDRLTVTAVRFDHTRIRATSIRIGDVADSFAAGQTLAERLAAPDLTLVFVVSDGHFVNGSALVQGFNRRLPPGTLLTGGLAGDGVRFERTLVGLDALPAEGVIAAVGFYGDRLRVGFGSSGGWAPFGPVRRITRSEANVLYELDGRSALALYKRYLGELAEGLPGAALRFPLCIWTPDGDRTLVRTILSIDEENQSMTFAGDVPTGACARFMRASYEDLVDGAAYAAEHCVRDSRIEDAELAICVSCWGRKLVLGQRTEEETEVVREMLGTQPVITGFYSYGELAPPESAEWCELHNQTMTITIMKEIE
ncbi:FIST signal transduction protein [Rhodocaloribacter sp.]